MQCVFVLFFQILKAKTHQGNEMVEKDPKIFITVYDFMIQNINIYIIYFTYINIPYPPQK